MTTTTTLRLTAVEAAALAGVDEGKVYKDVEHRILPKGPLSFSALLYLRTIQELGVELGVADRKKLYAALDERAARLARIEEVALSPIVIVDVGPLARALRRRLTSFQAWKSKLVEDDAILGGEVVFPKSRLSVRRVGALAARVGTKEILEDYPYLDEKDVDFAKLYVRAYPRVGRPRAPRAAAR